MICIAYRPITSVTQRSVTFDCLPPTSVPCGLALTIPRLLRAPFPVTGSSEFDLEENAMANTVPDVAHRILETSARTDQASSEFQRGMFWGRNHGVATRGRCRFRGASCRDFPDQKRARPNHGIARRSLSCRSSKITTIEFSCPKLISESEFKVMRVLQNGRQIGESCGHVVFPDKAFWCPCQNCLATRFSPRLEKHAAVERRGKSSFSPTQTDARSQRTNA